MRRRASNYDVAKSLGAVLAGCVAIALVAGGCSKGKDEKATGDGHGHGHSHAHDHPTVGPHQGAIVAWGDHAHHLELTFDRAKQQATVYVLDHDIKKPEPTTIEMPMLKLDGVNELIPFVPTPLDGETSEKASRYVATHAALGEEKPFSGAVSGTVKSEPYFGSFKETGAKSATKGDNDHDHPHGEHPHGDGDGHDEDGHDAHEDSNSPATGEKADAANGPGHKHPPE